jgi:hypothetical protein
VSPFDNFSLHVINEVGLLRSPKNRKMLGSLEISLSPAAILPYPVGALRYSTNGGGVIETRSKRGGGSP